MPPTASPTSRPLDAVTTGHPFSSRTQGRRVATTALSLVLAALPALGGGGPYNETIQPGAWSDPSTWSLGIAPTAPHDAYVRHDVTIQQPGFDPATISVDQPGPDDALRILEGADLSAALTTVGGNQPGRIEQSGGMSRLGFMHGATGTSHGSVVVSGGRFDAGTMLLGSEAHGQDGALVVAGGEADVTVARMTFEPPWPWSTWTAAPWTSTWPPRASTCRRV